VFVLVVSFIFVVGYNPQQYKIKHKIESMKIMLLMLRFLFLLVFVLVVDFVFVVGYNPHQHKTQDQKHENHVFTVAFFNMGVFVLVIDFAFVVRYNPQPHKTQDYALL